jgi:flap endonuclease-1
MGSDIGSILEKETIEFKSMEGRKLAVDSYNTIYQFLSIIRQPDGTLLMDSKGKVTSHLAGLLYRVANIIEIGIKPIFVFDGEPPPFKLKTIEARAAAKEVARVKMQEAKEKGIEDVKRWAQATSRITPEILEGSKKLLDYMGVPVIQAPSEGEAQAAWMCKEGHVWAAASQDYDSVLFGAPRLLRNLTLSGKRKLPSKGVYINIEPEIIDLSKTLKVLELDRKQLVWVAMMVGNDYNSGIKGIGPKKGLEIAKKASSIKECFDLAKASQDYYGELEEIEHFYMAPKVNEVDIEFKEPRRDKIIDFLCGQHEFSIERVERAIDKIEKKPEKTGQSRLEGWF